ncbi:MAG: transcriptional regulator, Crp/Fnr family [Firmicutes bacterium]|nr:transcriptional regulator, Crp/Fnr family [Bacillota bacterium]
MIKKLINEIADTKSRQWLFNLLQFMSDEVLQNCRLLYRKKGTTLIHVGDMADSAYLLVEGSVKIINELPNGVVYSFAKLYAPELLGENELLANFPCYRGTVVCETDCKFIYLSKKDFLLWLKKSPETLYQVTVAIIKKTGLLIILRNIMRLKQKMIFVC